MVECLPLMRPTSSSTCFFRAAYDATFSRDGTVTSTSTTRPRHSGKRSRNASKASRRSGMPLE